VTPHYADDWLTVYQGDALAVLSELPAESVHCVVTSPPYWGLRDYGTAVWAGGDADCDHKGVPLASSSSPLAGYTSENVKVRTNTVPMGQTCRKCGATRIDAQLGLEPTPEAYVEAMVGVFREVRRVLRDDGTLWLNMGDSYVANGSGQVPQTKDHKGSGFAGPNRDGQTGLKPKDLVGIPWRLAFALQADGWYLRSDIIWAKPNPMPESVTDRPTKSHEYLFLMSKSARYYFDQEAVREAPAPYERPGGTAPWTADSGHTNGVGSDTFHQMSTAGRNIRSVWTVATAPYPGAHFATFPPKLVEPCIKAGCPSGGIVLDPFAGSGTTGMVAQSLSRRAVLIDLSMDYLGQLLHRNRQKPLGI
jgi:DNA modification methylase